MGLKNLFTLLSIFSACTFCFGQEGVVRGTVTAAGVPLEFVNVGVKGTSLGSATDVNGQFEIPNVPLGKHKLVISIIGFNTVVREVHLEAGAPLQLLDVVLVESTGTLDEVVVSGTMKEVSRLETPVPVEVYSDKFFKANPTPSIFEALQNINGVRPQVNCNVCNTGDIHINGLEGPYTMVLIDGMPIVSGLSTVYGLTGIPQSLIERVEIVKGPASTLYGSEAVGGLVNIITRNPSKVPLVSVDVFSSTWAEVNADASFKFNIGDRVQNMTGVNYFNYQNPMDNNGDGFTDVTLQNRISVFNKMNIARKENRVFSLAGRYLYEDRWGGEMNWTPEYRGGDQVYGESIYTSRWEAMGVYQLPTKESIRLQFSANGHKQNSVYGNTLFNADQYIGFGQLTWNRPVGKFHDLLVGAAYRYTYYDDDTPATKEAGITHLPGLFIQDEIKINSQHSLLAGMRYDHNSLHGGIFSPRVNYKWSSHDKQTVLRFSTGNGYRVANVFTEDHAALTGARDVVFVGDLAPETSWNFNLNAVQKFMTSNNVYIGLDGSVFYTYFSNRIVPDYETNPNQIIYSNLDGSAVSKGVSLNSEVSWTSGLTLNAGATLMDVSITEDGESTRQLLTERFSGVWSIRYNIPGIDLAIDYTGNVYSPMRLPLLGPLDDRDEYSPWFSIQNIQLTKRFGLWEVYGGVKNLLNFTPASNSIARPFDPFDQNVVFDESGMVVPTPDNPNALTFDPSYVYAPNQGIRGFLGFRYSLRK